MIEARRAALSGLILSCSLLSCAAPPEQPSAAPGPTAQPAAPPAAPAEVAPPALSARERAEAKIAQFEQRQAAKVDAPSDETSSDPRRPTDEVASLLARQAEAMQRFRVDAWLETFVPERRAAEREIFLRLRPLPFREVVLRRTDLLAEEGEIRVELLYRLHDIPADNPFIHRLRYRLKRTGETLHVAEILDDADRPIPWRRGELAVHRANHFLILADPALQSELTEAAGALEAAWGDLLRRGFPVTSGYLVHLIADRRFYARVAGNARSLGVARWEYVRRGENIRVHSRAFWVNGSWWIGRSRRDYDEIQRETLTHELVHLALSGVTRPTTPPWLKEGAAVYFSRGTSFDENRDLLRRGLERLDLEALTEEGIAGHADTRRDADEYLYASNLVADLVERRGGQDRFLEFYAAYAKTEVPWGGALGMPRGTRLQITRKLLQERYEISLDDLDHAVQERLAVIHR